MDLCALCASPDTVEKKKRTVEWGEEKNGSKVNECSTVLSLSRCRAILWWPLPPPSPVTRPFHIHYTCTRVRSRTEHDPGKIDDVISRSPVHCAQTRANRRSLATVSPTCLPPRTRTIVSCGPGETNEPFHCPGADFRWRFPLIFRVPRKVASISPQSVFKSFVFVSCQSRRRWILNLPVTKRKNCERSKYKNNKK